MTQVFIRKLARLDKGPQFLGGPGDLDHVSAHMLPDELLGFAFYEDQTMIDDDESVTLGSLTRLTLGEYRSIPETRSLLAEIMTEVEAVARGSGVPLDQDAVQKWLEFIDESSAEIKPSMQLDVEAGHRTEIESMIGVVSRKGRELGIATPAVDYIYASLLPVELKTHHMA